LTSLISFRPRDLRDEQLQTGGQRRSRRHPFGV